MKNLKINISIISLLLLINFVNADHLIDLRILSSNNSSFIIQLSDIKYDTKCLLKNQQGVILYKEDIARAQIFQRSLNLIELPDGTYELQIEDDYKTETTSLTKSNGKVMTANQIKITTFKPQIVLKDTQLNVSLLALNNEKLTVSILDENQNIISEKKLSGSVNLGQSYDLSQLNAGNYTIQLYTNGKVYDKLITLN
ncbi:hypothetical protein N9A68_00410 [Cyclobacteriaceae bacterium]|jgi:hypothetical protein|nr:hypothetical protein [Cyclobacteriaceae bacterium]MDB4314894.1 hypothetical protein [Cyclobacteriaceae bacterium]MDC1369524.1 hypothetical protein [Cyclobacteriaceae bacterium]